MQEYIDIGGRYQALRARDGCLEKRRESLRHACYKRDLAGSNSIPLMERVEAASKLRIDAAPTFPIFRIVAVSYAKFGMG